MVIRTTKGETIRARSIELDGYGGIEIAFRDAQSGRMIRCWESQLEKGVFRGRTGKEIFRVREEDVAGLREEARRAWEMSGGLKGR